MVEYLKKIFNWKTIIILIVLLLTIRFIIYWPTVYWVYFNLPPLADLFYWWDEHIYYCHGICPGCGFHSLENGMTWIFYKQDEDAIKNDGWIFYELLKYSSELVWIYTGDPDAVYYYRLIDIEPTWECVFHYYRCIGVYTWVELWEIDKWKTIYYFTEKFELVFNFYLEPIMTVYEWLTECFVTLIGYDNYFKLMLKWVTIEKSQSFDTLFVKWLKILALAVSTIWARGVGPRTRPDQLSDITWTILIILTVFIFLNIMICLLLT